MADDWRVTITLESDDDANGVLRILHKRDVQDALGSRVAVSSDGPHLFLYADTRRAAEAGERALREVLGEEGLRGTPELTHWHPVEERWESPDVHLSDAEEHQRLEAEETEESLEENVAEWEVRVELASHRDAEEFAKRLEDEGATVTRRWRYLLVSANDSDDANALAKRIEAEAPEGATVHVEPGAGLAWELMPRNPFAIFGGLAG
ncbi:MAG TPA: hypothetical protein VFB25_09675 [Gaiellaceae bacterium]|nr:hypothetical protein [Gaiellaceae bacterium]